MLKLQNGTIYKKRVTYSFFNHSIRVVFLCPILKAITLLNCHKFVIMEPASIAKLEAQAGRKAAAILKKSLITQIRSVFETTQGNSELLKSTITSRMKEVELQRLIIKMPHYGFKQHFGFEGVKSNGVKLRLINATNFLNDALLTNNTLETLATEIGELRGDLVISKINF